MLYSVYNKSMGLYEVYRGPVTRPRPRLGPARTLGSAPEESTEILPSDAEYLGQSEMAEGRIVEKERGVYDFAKEFVFLIAAAMLGRWLYERFLS